MRGELLLAWTYFHGDDVNDRDHDHDDYDRFHCYGCDYHDYDYHDHYQ
jgi:hypothetical protein